MKDRHNDILRIRPQIKKYQTFETMSSEERFQNSTLRPVLKLQNPPTPRLFCQLCHQTQGRIF